MLEIVVLGKRNTRHSEVATVRVCTTGIRGTLKLRKIFLLFVFPSESFHTAHPETSFLFLTFLQLYLLNTRLNKTQNSSSPNTNSMSSLELSDSTRETLVADYCLPINYFKSFELGGYRVMSRDAGISRQSLVNGFVHARIGVG